MATPPHGAEGPLPPLSERVEIYRMVMQRLEKAGIPFLLGGAFALGYYCGIERDTRDLDLFLKREDQDRAMSVMEEAGFSIERTAPHWLTKAYRGPVFIDFIFGLANGIGRVDESWFQAAPHAETLGRRVQLIPPEEMLWSKAFIMDRDRFDGADIYHLIRSIGRRLDWQRLFSLFDSHWRVLLAHLILFGYVYPADQTQVPERVLNTLLGRLGQELGGPGGSQAVCRGTLLSRSQYEKDLKVDKLADARLQPIGTLTPEQAAQ